MFALANEQEARGLAKVPRSPANAARSSPIRKRMTGGSATDQTRPVQPPRADDVIARMKMIEPVRDEL